MKNRICVRNGTIESKKAKNKEDIKIKNSNSFQMINQNIMLNKTCLLIIYKH